MDYTVCISVFQLFEADFNDGSQVFITFADSNCDAKIATNEWYHTAISQYIEKSPFLRGLWSVITKSNKLTNTECCSSSIIDLCNNTYDKTILTTNKCRYIKFQGRIIDNTEFKRQYSQIAITINGNSNNAIIGNHSAIG